MNRWPEEATEETKTQKVIVSTNGMGVTIAYFEGTDPHIDSNVIAKSERFDSQRQVSSALINAGYHNISYS